MEKPDYKEKLRLRSYGLPQPDTTVYTVMLKDVRQEKEMLDQIRQRNGNLNITCSRSASLREDL